MFVRLYFVEETLCSFITAQRLFEYLLQSANA